MESCLMIPENWRCLVPVPVQQEVEVDWSKASTSVQLLIEAGLSTETRQDQDQWIPALAHHAATDVYESTDDYDQIQFVRDAYQHHWLHDYKTLAMTQRDLNYLTEWVDDVKAAHPIRNNEEMLKVPRLSWTSNNR